MNKFEQYNLHLSEKQKNTVKVYLAKLKIFVTKYDLDEDLYNDIEEMVFEKLSNEKNLTDLKIAKMLQDVGEPEEIFSDSIGIVSDEPQPFYERLEASGWIRDNADALILGVSKTLAHKMGIPVWFVRILFLVLLIPFGMTFFIYLGLAIILPRKGKDYTGMTPMSYIQAQLPIVASDLFNNLRKNFTWIFVVVAKNLWKIITYLARHLGTALRIIFFTVLGICMLIVLLAMLTLASLYFTQFTIFFVDFAGVFPDYFIIAPLAGALAFGIFAPLCFSWAFARKRFPLSLVLLGWFALVVSVGVFISSGLNLGQRYTPMNTWQGEVSQTLEAGKYTVDFSDIWDERNTLRSYDNDVEIVRSPDNVFRAMLRSTVHGDQEIYESFTQGAAPLVLIKNERTLKLTFEGGQRFTQKTLLAPRGNKLILSIPANMELEVSPRYNYHLDVPLSQEYQKYSDVIPRGCNGRIITYSAKEEKFVCKLTEEELSEAKEAYVIDYAGRHFEDIVTLKHSSRYQTKEYNRYSHEYSDWDIEDIEIDEQDRSRLLLTFSDRSLHIEAIVRFVETETVPQFSEFTIQDVIIWGGFTEENYKDISSIQEYLD